MKRMLVLMVLFFVFSSQRGWTEQIVLLENGNVIKEVRVVLGVSEGISAETAYNGKIKDGVVNDKKRIAGQRFDWIIAIFCFWIPALFILIVSIANPLSGARKFFVFCVSIFVGMLAGLFAGELVGASAGAFAGASAGMLAGLFAGVLAGESVGKSADELEGVLAGAFAGAFAGKENYEMMVYYLVFLCSIEAVSFILSRFIDAVKKRMPVIKKLVEAR